MEKDARSLSTEAKEALRLRAVKAVLGGISQLSAASAFGVTRQAIGKWMKSYRQGGLRRLQARPQGRPRTGGKLKGWQAATICNLIRDRHPEQLRLPFALWTRDAIRLLIKRKFGVKLSRWTVGRYLRRWGFTPQKPRRRAYEQDGEAVRQWLEEDYPKIRRLAKREKACIYWGDEMGLRSDCQVGRSYAPKGRTPVIPGTGRRFGCNMISAITNRGSLAFMVFKRRFANPVFLQFLSRLCKHSKRKAFLIVDGHPVHRSRVVRRWLEEHEDRLQVFFLPGYSPQLNPDEMLNQDVKANAVGRRRAKDQKELMRNVRGYLAKRRRDAELVKRYFHEESVRYAAV